MKFGRPRLARHRKQECDKDGIGNTEGAGSSVPLVAAVRLERRRRALGRRTALVSISMCAEGRVNGALQLRL